MSDRALGKLIIIEATSLTSGQGTIHIILKRAPERPFAALVRNGNKGPEMAAWPSLGEVISAIVEANSVDQHRQQYPLDYSTMRLRAKSPAALRTAALETE